MNKKDKESLLRIERAVLALMETPQNEQVCNEIASALSDCFDAEFTVVCVPARDDEYFIMSVYPEQSTMNTIIKALTDGENEKTIEKLWAKNKKWTIEIDEKIFGNNPKVTEKEVTAMLLHEVGHIALSNKVTSRVMNILRYEIAKASVANKVAIADKLFSGVMSLPIVSACIANKKDGNINEEIKADKFATKMGYKVYLASALNKFSKANVFQSANDNVEAASKYSLDIVSAFNRRQDALNKKSLFNLMNSHTSPFVKEMVEDTYNRLYNPTYKDMNEEKRVELIHESIESKAMDALFESPLFFGKKTIKRIDPNSIDYVKISAQKIRSTDDKMLTISYARHLIDLIDYQLKLYSIDANSEKYVITDSPEQLKMYRRDLEKVIDYVMNYRIPKYDPQLLVQYPAGFEG